MRVKKLSRSISILFFSCLVCFSLASCACVNNDLNSNNEANMSNESQLSDETHQQEEPLPEDENVEEQNAIIVEDEFHPDLTQAGLTRDCAGWYRVLVPQGMFFDDNLESLIPTTQLDHDYFIRASLNTNSQEETPASIEFDFLSSAYEINQGDSNFKQEELDFNGRHWTALSYTMPYDDENGSEEIVSVVSPIDSENYILIDSTYGLGSAELQTVLSSFEVLPGSPLENYMNYINELYGSQDNFDTDIEVEENYVQEVPVETEQPLSEIPTAEPAPIG